MNINNFSEIAQLSVQMIAVSFALGSWSVKSTALL
jgi:hypothetical protein